MPTRVVPTLYLLQNNFLYKKVAVRVLIVIASFPLSVAHCLGAKVLLVIGTAGSL